MDKTIGTVCFIVNNSDVLLAQIEYPNGKRLWNGIGGVVDMGETPTQAVVREISEETKLRVSEEDVREHSVITIGKLQLHVFTTDKWTGELKTIDPTLKQLKWFNFGEVPYSQMHTDNDDWLPGILKTFNN